MIDQTDFANTLTTLNLSAVMCKGFEQEAYGGMIGLIQFRYHTDGFRLGWDRACRKWANENPSPPGGPFFSPHKTFFRSLMMARAAAFGNGTTLKDINDSDALTANPWSLTDPEFERCVAYVRNKDDPKLAEFDKSLLSENQKYALQIGGPLAQKAMGSFMAEAAPELVAATGELLEMAAWPLAIAGAALSLAQFGLAKVTHAENIRRYQIDGVRREYLTQAGRGTFRFSNVGGKLAA